MGGLDFYENHKYTASMVITDHWAAHWAHHCDYQEFEYAADLLQLLSGGTADGSRFIERH